jgi:hypothetical protein
MDEASDARALAQEVLLVFMTRDPAAPRPLVDYGALHLFGERSGHSRKIIADAVEAAMRLGWIEAKLDRGFLLTSAGKEELARQRRQRSA